MFNSFGRFCSGFSDFGRTNTGGYIMMGIGVILFVVLIYFIFKKGSLTNDTKTDSALDMLKKRYVSGEIDEDEYLKKKGVLESK